MHTDAAAHRRERHPAPYQIQRILELALGNEGHVGRDVEMRRAVRLAWGYSLTVEVVKTGRLLVYNAARLFAPALLSVNHDDAIHFALGDGLIGADKRADRFSTVIAGSSHVAHEEVGIIALFLVKNAHPPRGTGRYIMPVLAGDGTGETSSAPCLIEVET
jgi:hypothetical protein